MQWGFIAMLLGWNGDISSSAVLGVCRWTCFSQESFKLRGSRCFSQNSKPLQEGKKNGLQGDISAFKVSKDVVCVGTESRFGRSIDSSKIGYRGWDGRSPVP